MIYKMQKKYWLCSSWTHGKSRKDQFTVIGTHVNLASRLEGIAEGIKSLYHNIQWKRLTKTKIQSGIYSIKRRKNKSI